MSTPVIRTLRRAAQTLGGKQQLADALGATLTEVDAWLAGSATPSDQVYLTALDIVAQGARWEPKKPAR